MSLGTGEDPFKVIDGCFTDAYDPDAVDPGKVFRGAGGEILAGQQENGWPLNLFRPVIGDIGGDNDNAVFTVILQNPPAGATTSEYEVRDGTPKPSVREILSRDPFKARYLTESEMAVLARKIGRTTFL